MTLSSSTLKTDIWNAFRTLVVDNVISVTIKGSGGANTKTVTVQNYSQSYPDTVFDNKANYPMIVINSPEFNFNPVTFRNRELSGTIELEVFANQSEAADKILDLINKTIMDNESTLMSLGVKETELDSTDSNNYDRNNMSVQSRIVVWRYVFSW